MAALTLSQEDIQELLALLTVALYDSEAAKSISRELEMIDTIEEHREAIRKWIHRLSQQIESEEQQGKPRVDIEAKDAEAQAHEDWSNDE